MKIYAYKERDGLIRPFRLRPHARGGGSQQWWMEVDGKIQTLISKDGERSDYGQSLDWLIRLHGIEVTGVGSLVPGPCIPEDMQMDEGL